MADVQVVDFTARPWTDGSGSASTTAAGDVQSKPSDLVDYSLWASLVRLGDGASLTWSENHGDEVVAVLSGSLEIDGVTVPTGGSVLVEAGTAITVRAPEACELIHYGPTDPVPPTAGAFGPARARTEGDPGYHVRGPLGREHRTMTFMDEQLDNAFHADSTCPTCRTTLLRVSAHGPMTFPSHLHSEDELIYVFNGGFMVGPMEAKAGTLLAVPAQRRYGIRSTTEFEFLNYRRDVSTIQIKPNEEPRMEIAEEGGYQPSPPLVGAAAGAAQPA